MKKSHRPSRPTNKSNASTRGDKSPAPRRKSSTASSKRSKRSRTDHKPAQKSLVSKRDDEQQQKRLVINARKPPAVEKSASRKTRQSPSVPNPAPPPLNNPIPQQTNFQPVVLSHNPKASKSSKRNKSTKPIVIAPICQKDDATTGTTKTENQKTSGGARSQSMTAPKDPSMTAPKDPAPPTEQKRKPKQESKEEDDEDFPDGVLLIVTKLPQKVLDKEKAEEQKEQENVPDKGNENDKKKPPLKSKAKLTAEQLAETQKVSEDDDD